MAIEMTPAAIFAHKGNMAMTPVYNGPRFGVERAEFNERTNVQYYSAAIYDHNGKVINLSDARYPYGEAFEAAHRWSKSLGQQ